MKRVLLALLLLAPPVLLAAMAAPAQGLPPLPEPVTARTALPRPLQPFVATYSVLRDGKPFGDATLQLARLEGRRWRVDLGIRGTRGLIGLAGLNLQQSTLFEAGDALYRPLSQSTVRKALIGSRKSTGVYDWSTQRAQWQGDVKQTRRAAVALREGDMSGLLINLALLRDAQPGATLQYRFVDDGRVRDHHYNVSTELDEVQVGELNYSAMRVTRVESGNEETVIWVVEGVPTPVRMLQRENGEDTFDLRLVEYKGAQ